MSTAVSTAGSTQNVTVSGLGTPDLAVVQAVRQTGTGTSGPKFGICTSFGMSDFTTSGVVGQSEQNAAATTDTNRFHNAGRVIQFVDPAAGTLEFYGEVATTTDGITISWKDSGGSAYTPVSGEEYRLVVELWKVSGMSVSVDWVTSSATQDATVETTVGFEPEALRIFTNRSSSADGIYTHGQISLGAAWWGGGSIRDHSMNYGAKDADGSAEPHVYTSTSRSTINVFNGGKDQAIEWTARSTTSHTLTTRDDNGSMKLLVCAIGVGTDHVILGRDAAKTSSGVQSHTLTFQPYFTWNVDTYAPSEATHYHATDEASGWSSTVFTDASAGNQATVFIRSEALADPTSNYCGAVEGKARYLYTSTGTVRVDADLDSITATGYDADYNTAAADTRQSFTFALGASASALRENSEETVTTSEDTGVAWTRYREGDDTLTLSEDAHVSFRLYDSADDTLTMTEGTGYLLRRYDSADDSLTLSDAGAEVTTAIKGSAETLTLTEDTGTYTLGGQEVQQMPKTRETTQVVWEGTAPILIDRVWDDYASDYLLPSECVDVTMAVYDLDGATPNTAIVDLPFGADEMLAATVTDHPSGLPDSGGHNFSFRMHPEWLPEGGRKYRVEFTFRVVGNTEEVPIREVPVVFLLRTQARSST